MATAVGVVDQIKRPPKLVRVPARDGNWATVGSGGTITFIEGYGWALDVSSGGLLQLALRTTFRGRFIEIRFNNQVNTNILPPTMHLVIDGEIVPWPKPQVRYWSVVQGSGTPKNEVGANFFIPIYDLDDREHTLDIVCTSDPSTTTRIDIFGFNLEEHAAYLPDPLPYRRSTQQAITSSAVAIPLQYGQTPSHLRTFAFVSRLELTNPATATLSGLLSTGAPITSLPVNALPQAIASGVTLTISSGGNTQAWTTTGTAAVGATTVPVSSQTPNFAYPAQSAVAIGGITARTIQINAPANNWNTGGSSTYTAGSVWGVTVAPDERVIVDPYDPTSGNNVTVRDVTGAGTASAFVTTVGRAVA